MGMFDNVVFLDQRLTCPAGHPIGELQTKSFPDPSMSTYLVQGERVFLAERGPWDDEDERSAWRISGGEAIYERRHSLRPVSPPSEVFVYSHCSECEPVLVRADHQPRISATGNDSWGSASEARVCPLATLRVRRYAPLAASGSEKTSMTRSSRLTIQYSGTPKRA
jgi:hypothetical protein